MESPPRSCPVVEGPGWGVGRRLGSFSSCAARSRFCRVSPSCRRRAVPCERLRGGGGGVEVSVRAPGRRRHLPPRSEGLPGPYRGQGPPAFGSRAGLGRL
eukprot:690841-Pyramimonas_sp.AAC.1